MEGLLAPARFTRRSTRVKVINVIGKRTSNMNLRLISTKRLTSTFKKQREVAIFERLRSHTEQVPSLELVVEIISPIAPPPQFSGAALNYWGVYAPKETIASPQFTLNATT
ncbi:hypothetical protein Y032_0098g3099 [Ancylostoma ceylanicum]|uniref:Uncharacterized protein n=1 Tax=Ancylostoma ceylanicum TaxID=53326 RepID=A0A016TJ64_9BILA|nr:hypothetical protein Y032_0098g3099 [Ancylostoma ceylanicum]